jgi:hypothetical protein
MASTAGAPAKYFPSISRSIFPACGMMDIEQPMMHIRLCREGGRYMESADIKKKGKGKEKIHLQ